MRKFLCSLLLSLFSWSVVGQASETDYYVRVAHFDMDSPIFALHQDRVLIDAIAFGEVSEWVRVNLETPLNLQAEGGVIVEIPMFAPTQGAYITLVIGREREIYPIGASTGGIEGARLTLINTLASEIALNVIVDDQVRAAQWESGIVTIDVASDSREITLESVESGAILLTQALALQMGQDYLIGVVEKDDQAQLVIVGSGIAGRALLRVAHFSSGSSPLDIYIDGENDHFGRIYFPEITPWQRFETGVISVMITLPDQSEALIPPIEITLTDRSYTTLFVIGTTANESLQLHTVQEDFSPLALGDVRVNVFNALPGTNLDVLTPDETGENAIVLIDGLGFPGFFGGNDGFDSFIVPEGAYNLRVLFAETQDVLFELPDTNFFNGRNYLIAAINANPPFVVTFSDLVETEALFGD
ncbi:MAG: DUF4397 domain-containing protein [Anaerolineae bacterium]|jgi:hypothetical protein|nr:DUF4397 domain-containing protein [Anaerolineae bacterium]